MYTYQVEEYTDEYGSGYADYGAETGYNEFEYPTRCVTEKGV